LITTAQALLTVIQSLDSHFGTIHGIALLKTHLTITSRAKVIGQLWTLLGGNRWRLTTFDTELVLLNKVGEYQLLAFAHFSAVILKSQVIGAELESSNEQMGSKEIVGRALPLDVHIERLRTSIASLERARYEGRVVEVEALRRAVDPEKGVGADPLGWKSEGRGIVKP
jgi:hypothetical protein